MTVYNSFNSLCCNLNFMLRSRKCKKLVPFSKFNVLFLNKLQGLGYVSSFSVCLIKKNYNDTGRYYILVNLILKDGFVLPFQGLFVLFHSKRYGHLSYIDLLHQRISPGVLLLSTKFGILTRTEALFQKVGGVPLVRIW